MRAQVVHAWWLVRTLVRSGMIALLRPDRYVRMVRVLRRQGTSATTGFALAAAREPNAVGLIDERGSLTWAELDERCDALAAALAERGERTVAILCRNHRGFVEALVAVSRVGADALLLNTGFSAPQLAEVLQREAAEVIVYDEEFAGIVATARATNPRLSPIIAWTDTGAADVPLVDDLVAAHLGERPPKPKRGGKIVLLTSGTTGTPKGARRSGGGIGSLAGMLERIPWRAGQTTVVVAPMFHAWGFGQLVISATMTCTVVTTRRFDPETTLRLVERHAASGLALVPVMLERIVDLPAEVLDKYRLATLRFVTASGSRMRPDAVTRFMDRFGDVVHNSYNATEAGMITVATPDDLRAAPDTAGRPVVGARVRIVDDEFADVPRGEVGRITVASDSQFEGYTSGDTKDFHEQFMITGDVGRLDSAGRLYVVGRDDEMIVSGGENVYPAEVEKVLNACAGVREAAVVGVDDEAYGQRLAAFVVLDPGATLSADDLKLHVKERLAGYKVPRDVTLLAELPRNASGKVATLELRETSA